MGEGLAERAHALVQQLPCPPHGTFSPRSPAPHRLEAVPTRCSCSRPGARVASCLPCVLFSWLLPTLVPRWDSLHVLPLPYSLKVHPRDGFCFKGFVSGLVWEIQTSKNNKDSKTQVLIYSF